MKVIESLGIKDEVLRKATVAKDGVETMRLVLEEKFDIGVTQVPEILQASRDAVAAPFPRELELATTYSLWHRNNISQAARAFRCTCSRMGLRYCSRSRLPNSTSLRPSATTNSTSVTPISPKTVRIHGSW